MNVRSARRLVTASSGKGNSSRLIDVPLGATLRARGHADDTAYWPVLTDHGEGPSRQCHA